MKPLVEWISNRDTNMALILAFAIAFILQILVVPYMPTIAEFLKILVLLIGGLVQLARMDDAHS